MGLVLARKKLGSCCLWGCFRSLASAPALPSYFCFSLNAAFIVSFRGWKSTGAGSSGYSHRNAVPIPLKADTDLKGFVLVVEFVCLTGRVTN